MGWISTLLVFGVIWWLVFFMTLPVGVRSQDESGEGVVPGTPSSAPVRPHIWRKAGVTTVIALVLTALILLAVNTGWLSVR